MKKLLKIILSFIMMLSLVACGSPTDTNSAPSEKVASGEDYEILVFNAFWENTCSSFGVNYSDYKETHTAYSYISDSTTSDGYTAYYYLIKTAFDTKNAFGQKITHEVTARCYYVPDYSDLVYVTYITLDGEKVLFDEEKEDWLLGIGGSSANANSTNSTVSHSSTTSSKVEKPNTSSSETVSNNHNDEMDEVDKELAYQDWLSNLPTLDDYEVETEEQNDNSNDWTFEYEEEEEDNGDLDGIATQLPDELLEELENASP